MSIAATSLWLRIELIALLSNGNMIKEVKLLKMKLPAQKEQGRFIGFRKSLRHTEIIAYGKADKLLHGIR